MTILLAILFGLYFGIGGVLAGMYIVLTAPHYDEDGLKPIIKNVLGLVFAWPFMLK